MDAIRDAWRVRIARALEKVLADAGQEGHIDAAQVIAEIPPKPELGDLGFPMFGFAKTLRKGPPQIAQLVAAALAADSIAEDLGKGSFAAEGPYVNVRLDRPSVTASVLAQTADESVPVGRPGNFAGSRITVEFSSPNTNKPLHLGHLRNDILGESISRILAACGAEVRKVCIINDRGIHICKSMLAYKEYGEGKTPASEHIKSDHFVGHWYVKYHQMSQTDSGAEARAQDMLRKWEAGDTETVKLWQTMKDWTVDGMKETYERTGISFDQYYYESNTYLLGKDEVLKGLEQGIFYREPDGAVAVDLTAEKLDKKILLRKDGTSIYITQDFGTAIFRHNDWPFDRMVYVVGSEQQYHFQVLFAILKKLGYQWADNLYHLSYGMVNLPEGKMKSREGTVVDADDLIDSLRDLALEEIRSKDREEAVGDSAEVAEKIALGALHYYLLQVTPAKDMLFDPKESLSFNGNTGPYLQYMGARISSILRKADSNTNGAAEGLLKPELLSNDAEWELIKTISAYPQAVADAATRMDPSVLAAYLYDLSKGFSRFYHDCPILSAADPALAAGRLALSKAVLRVLRDALNLIGIPFLETM
ncbi:arginine--tRNA ligase [Treponema primitia]|uniref:arginine--tRNA ligase n=1 Tax=Treponema primitia TaxID=88058 RepID=UPI0002554C6C|nr:arginine--tRNA ligase [Treponema primitia]